ncbi:1,6-anhydro-N-acetylmuramyl-L-alanine amidase AmpD [Aestuariibacter sp. AA17]|uniref:1,6-anhydro-N-acetylmuramyl-L-alanine amidase AmpD n=1 Tax=Fluctibacter corallii TaxID=2984329 RepID=A0ABT3A8B3_9ALTE|nr:1,6-anhydro-N-acetylmuramyl-L-alanine amidase AmpD [Aestuariibacter sp. AA17]MCV2884922.1 1,6-anhydro-N-acetylmuramyl-L-alanine amidase AmpD [Aestuariibacter sp. AA17]
MKIKDGIINPSRVVFSDHHDERPAASDVSLLVIHNISLPPGQFGGGYIEQFFTGQLNPKAHPFFEEIHQMRVSSHLMISREGEVIQFVPLHRRAWHAGLSSFQGVERCNDYSIGIELEGTDTVPYTEAQYRALQQVTLAIQANYPRITLGRIVGHNDIAPFRKTDPGPAFNWQKYRTMLCE